MIFKKIVGLFLSSLVIISLTIGITTSLKLSSINANNITSLTTLSISGYKKAADENVSATDLNNEVVERNDNPSTRLEPAFDILLTNNRKIDLLKTGDLEIDLNKTNLDIADFAPITRFTFLQDFNVSAFTRSLFVQGFNVSVVSVNTDTELGEIAIRYHLQTLNDLTDDETNNNETNNGRFITIRIFNFSVNQPIKINAVLIGLICTFVILTTFCLLSFGIYQYNQARQNKKSLNKYLALTIKKEVGFYKLRTSLNSKVLFTKRTKKR